MCVQKYTFMNKSMGNILWSRIIYCVINYVILILTDIVKWPSKRVYKCILQSTVYDRPVDLHPLHYLLIKFKNCANLENERNAMLLFCFLNYE